MKTIKTIAALAASLAGLMLSAGAWASSYQITDLGTLGGTYSVGYGINAYGQVTGQVYTANNAGAHAFLWSNGVMQDLGPAGGNGYGGAINNAGQVIGQAVFPGVPNQQGYIYSAGTGMVAMGTLGSGGHTEADGLNNSGQVVGHSQHFSNDYYYAYLYTPGVGMQAIGEANSGANAINDAGQVTVDSGNRAYLWSAATGLQDLGTLGGTQASGRVINGAGDVAGWSTTAAGQCHGFLYTAAGGMRDIEAGSGWSGLTPYAINAKDQIIGLGTNQYGLQRPFLYSNGVVTDVGSLLPAGSGWYNVQYAYGINDSGQITGVGYSATGQHAYVLTPVPLPAALPAGGALLAALGAGARLRRRGARR